MKEQSSSDILFSIDSDTRRLIEDLIQQLGKTECNSIFGAARRKGHALDYDELKIYLRLRDARVSMGDMYELICRIEMELHDAIKTTLVERYGGGEKGWWREGVANEIRKCQDLREDDKEPAAEPFCYTTLVHLSKILEKQWALFAKALPDAVVNDKRKLLNELNKLNIIRNYVMHPVKAFPLLRMISFSCVSSTNGFNVTVGGRLPLDLGSDRRSGILVGSGTNVPEEPNRVEFNGHDSRRIDQRN